MLLIGIGIILIGVGIFYFNRKPTNQSISTSATIRSMSAVRDTDPSALASPLEVARLEAQSKLFIAQAAKARTLAELDKAELEARLVELQRERVELTRHHDIAVAFAERDNKIALYKKSSEIGTPIDKLADVQMEYAKVRAVLELKRGDMRIGIDGTTREIKAEADASRYILETSFRRIDDLRKRVTKLSDDLAKLKKKKKPSERVQQDIFLKEKELTHLLQELDERIQQTKAQQTED